LAVAVVVVQATPAETRPVHRKPAECFSRLCSSGGRVIPFAFLFEVEKCLNEKLHNYEV